MLIVKKILVIFHTETVLNTLAVRHSSIVIGYDYEVASSSLTHFTIEYCPGNPLKNTKQSNMLPAK